METSFIFMNFKNFFTEEGKIVTFDQSDSYMASLTNAF